MSEQHPYRNTIPPVLDDASRPLWSVMIPTYNCADYLRETLASVLAQDPGSELMQIEVVDDCSTKDDPESVVQELGKGRVNFYRQPQNQGHKGNFDTCLKRSRGKLVHILHGDDCVRDGFYRKMQFAFEQRPDIGAAFCRYILMDDQGHWKSISKLEQSESGVLKDWLKEIVTRLPIQPPSIVVRREVYEKLGGFDQRICCCGEDWEMWIRIAANYPMWYETEPLATYRVSSSSLTGNCARTGQNIRDLLQVIEIFQSYLPKAIASELSTKSRENWALWALYLAHRMVDKGDLSAAITQIRAAFQCSHSVKVIQQSVLPILRIGKRWNWQVSKGA